MNKRNSGFSIAEMIVVISIIAILTVIIYGSLSTARSRTRDQRRIADIASLQLSLEQYYNKNKYYPTSLSELVTAGFLPASGVSLSPSGQTYNYFPMSYGNSPICTSYQLWIELENQSALSSSTKKGFNSKGLLPSNLQACNGATNTIDASAANIYDVVQ